MFRRAEWILLSLIVIAGARSSVAAPPQFNASVGGVELLPQSIAGAAIFLFQVDGEIDGRSRRGFGWIAINHEDLPVIENETAAILGGQGRIYVGLRHYDVLVTGGELVLTDTNGTPEFDDVFGVDLQVDIYRRGECGPHGFSGVLDHRPFPPTIAGPLFVVP